MATAIDPSVIEAAGGGIPAPAAVVPPGQPPVVEAPVAAAVGTSALDLPFIQQIVQGRPGGYAFPAGVETPAVLAVANGMDQLLDAGLGFFRPKATKGINAIIFNPEIFSPEAVEKADKAGLLKDLFPPFLPENDPLLAAQLGTSPSTTGPSLVAAQSPGAQTATARRAVASDAAVRPSERAMPGAGSVLNDLVARSA